MTTKVLLTAVVRSASPPRCLHRATRPQMAGSIISAPPAVTRDCTPFNGPFGYYGNPWCDGGYKFAEDYPPGTGRYFDVFELPQVAASAAAGTEFYHLCHFAGSCPGLTAARGLAPLYPKLRRNALSRMPSS